MLSYFHFLPKIIKSSNNKKRNKIQWNWMHKLVIVFYLLTKLATKIFLMWCPSPFTLMIYLNTIFILYVCLYTARKSHTWFLWKVLGIMALKVESLVFNTMIVYSIFFCDTIQYYIGRSVFYLLYPGSLVL